MPEQPDNIVPITPDARTAAEKFSAEHDLELLTILFTDLVDSTKLQSDLGNLEAARLTELHRTIVRGELANYNAREIEWAGDSCLAVFPKPSDAVTFALKMQAEHRRVRDSETKLPLVRVGMHLGEILVKKHDGGGKKSEDLSGLQVSEAARVMSVARGNQIYCTRSVFDNAQGSLKGRDIPGLGAVVWLEHGLHELKGSDRPVEICEVGEKEFAPLKPPLITEKTRPVPTGPESMPKQAVSSIWKIVAGVGAGLALGLIAMILMSRPLASPPPESEPGVAAFTPAPPEIKRVRRFAMNLPSDQPIAPPDVADTPLALSPDGTLIVYRARIEREGVRLVMRRLGELDGQIIPGTTAGNRPTFSPDGQWIACVAVYNDKLMIVKIPVEGGPPVPLAEMSMTFPIKWGEDDYIVYAPAYLSGLMRVPASGGEPEVLTTLQEGEMGHAFPVVLPGAKGIVFTSFVEPHIESAQIKVLDLQTREVRLLFDRASASFYLPTGHLVFAQLGRLMAVTFDPDSLEVTGTPFDVTDPRMTDPDSTPSRIAVSASGTLVYVPSELDAADALTMVWIDMKGNETPLDLPPGPYGATRISPDGRRAVTVYNQGGNRDLWILDFERGTTSRFTYNRSTDREPLWTPDGRQIIFESNRGGGWGLYRKDVDDPGEPEKIFERPDHSARPTWVSPEGTELIFHSGGDIFVLALDGSENARPLLDSRFWEWGGKVSPDGKWIAYASDESGRPEVYVQAYPRLGSKMQISTDGGFAPLWSPDGDRMYYLFGEPTMHSMVVDIERDPDFSPGIPRLLFESPMWITWDIHPDGDRILALRSVGEDSLRVGGTELIIVENWFEQVKRLQPLEPQ